MSRWRRAGTALLLCAALAAAGALAGCGATQRTRTSGPTKPTATPTIAKAKPTPTHPPSAFGWLQPAPPPAGWSRARVVGSAELAYPASWHRVQADSGAASAAVVDRGSGLITQYLNATPQQGDETLENWATFRPAHNGNEGDEHVQVLAAARNLPFRDGRGSCVIDRYRTERARYQEIACLVRAPADATVIVAAALAGQWSRDSPVLERAVSAFVA